ncbi:MAG: magnesium transporter MgtE N-terminal domain-containing protein, partial [Micromonosporaceae bacterium]
MTTATRVYLARLADIAIYDPNGDQVGRVRDAVTRPRGGQSPRVIGLVAEIQARRRIFIPGGRITSIEADAVALSTGTLNLRRFSRRPGEILVLEDLLDRRVSITPPGDTDAGRRGIVVDVAMEQERNGDWVLARVAVREHTGRLTRRGQLRQLDWGEVSGLVGVPQQQGTANLLAVLDKMRAADLANVLQDLSGRRRMEVAAALEDERLADVLEELPEDDQVEILAGLDTERAADVLEEMSPDDAADLIAELPPDTAERLLTLMEPDEAEDVRRLLTYEEHTAGG